MTAAYRTQHSHMLTMALKTFRNPKPDLLALLKESGPPGEENGTKAGKKEETVKKKRKDKNVGVVV